VLCYVDGGKWCDVFVDVDVYLLWIFVIVFLVMQGFAFFDEVPPIPPFCCIHPVGNSGAIAIIKYYCILLLPKIRIFLTYCSTLTQGEFQSGRF
jgi:hypothetical protein